jgi:hypothetical protein
MSMSVIGTAGAEAAAAAAPARLPLRDPGRAAAGATLTSATVPQPWQSPHRPAHRIVRHPHSEHWNSAAGDFAMTAA